MSKHVMLALSALALVACGQQAAQKAESETPTSTPVVAQAPAVSDADFVAAVANADHYEIQLSQLAADRAARADVKEYAAMLVRDHSATSDQVAQIATALSLTPPTPVLSAAHSDRINNLRSSSGAAFDDAFLDTQVEVHENAVQLFERYLTSAPQGQLRTFAETTLPKLREHLQRGQSLENAT